MRKWGHTIVSQKNAFIRDKKKKSAPKSTKILNQKKENRRGKVKTNRTVPNYGLSYHPHVKRGKQRRKEREKKKAERRFCTTATEIYFKALREISQKGGTGAQETRQKSEIWSHREGTQNIASTRSI